MNKLVVSLLALSLFGCNYKPTADQKDQAAQERILQEGNSKVRIRKLKMNKLVVSLLALSLFGCNYKHTADQKDQEAQERILQEGNSKVGMPAIHNFKEKKLLKQIYELRDQENLQTWTYIVAEQTGKLVFLGRSIGYGIPYATQYTNPQKSELVNINGSGWHIVTLPQADPNGLFSPASADGTWVLMLSPDKQVHPVFIEPKIIVSPFPLHSEEDTVSVTVTATPAEK